MAEEIGRTVRMEKKSSAYYEFYESYLKYFDQYTFEQEYPRLISVAEALVRFLRPTKVLDVGCAKGFLVLAFRRRGVEAYGVDVSRYALEDSGNMRPYLCLVDVEKDDLPFDDNAFDLVTTLATIEHLRNYGHVLNEIRRVLKFSGFLYLDAGIRPTTGHVSIFPRSVWSRIFQAHGFQQKNRILLVQINLFKELYYIQGYAGALAKKFRLDKLGIIGKLARTSVRVPLSLGGRMGLTFLLTKEG